MNKRVCMIYLQKKKVSSQTSFFAISVYFNKLIFSYFSLVLSLTVPLLPKFIWDVVLTDDKKHGTDIWRLTGIMKGASKKLSKISRNAKMLVGKKKRGLNCYVISVCIFALYFAFTISDYNRIT